MLVAMVDRMMQRQGGQTMQQRVMAQMQSGNARGPMGMFSAIKRKRNAAAGNAGRTLLGG